MVLPRPVDPDDADDPDAAAVDGRSTTGLALGTTGRCTTGLALGTTGLSTTGLALGTAGLMAGLAFDTAPRLADDGRAIEAGSAQIPDGTSSSSYSDEIQTVSANSESV